MEDNFFNNDLDTQRVDELNRYLKEVVHYVLPQQYFSTTTSTNTKVVTELCVCNKNFRDSNYYYKGDLRFIHYTNLNSFFNILNEASIRLSDFNLFDDPQELVFAFNELGLSNFSLKTQELKSILFAISFCEYNEDLNPDGFDMWRLYGNDGKGIAFVFSFENNPDYWKNYYLSKVYYGENYLKIFNELNKKHEEFFKTSPITFQNHILDNGLNRLPLEISILLGFHKNSIYKIENEVRLINYLPINHLSTKRNFYNSINKNYEKGFYVKLPLDTEYAINSKDNNFPTNTPKIKIEKIILGYRYTENDLYKIKKIIYDVAVEKTKKRIETELSHLTKYFN